MRIQTPQRWAALLTAAGLLGTQSAQALSIKSVGSVVRGAVTQVTVVFDQTVESASGTALANYTLAGRTITSAVLLDGVPAANAVGNADFAPPSGRAENGQAVILTVAGTLSGNQTLTINGVRNAGASETLASTTRTFVPSGYKWATVGRPDGDPTRVIAVGTNGFDIYSNGQSNWDANDQIGYVFKEIPATQPFDMKVRVEFQDTSSRWGRAGLLLRDGLNEGAETSNADGSNPAARAVFARVNPARKFDENSGAIGVGQNQFEFIFRSDVGGNYAGPGEGTPPAYPNAWLRLVGDGAGTLRGYWSNDANPAADAFLPADGFDLSTTYANMINAGATTLFLGPAFCPEVGNINDAVNNLFPGANIKARRFLAQFRFIPIASPVISGFSGFAAGFTASIIDGADTTVQDGSVSATINGNAVTVNQTRTANRTAISAVVTSPFAVGSQNTVVVNFRDNTGAAISRTYTFTQASYVTLPTDWRVQAPTGADIHGMQVTSGSATHNNSLANVEGMFAGTFPADAPAELVTNVVLVANWGKSGNDGEFQGQFNANAAGTFKVAKTVYADAYGWSADNVATRAVTYLQLNPGVYRAAVASDDGFRLSVAAAAADPSGITLSQFDGGRGTGAPDLADFVVTQAGIYPFRLTWWNGGGGSALEWSIIDVASGRQYLVNQQRVDDTGAALSATQNLQAGAVVAYNRTPTVRTFQPSLSVTPAAGSHDNDIRPEVVVNINGYGATVTLGSLSFNGASVTPTTSTANGVTTARFTPAANLPFNTRVSGTVVYTASGYATPFTNAFSFTTRSVRASELAKPGVFVIEAEDFDFGAGQNVAAANTIPYDGGAYDGRGGRLGIDFQRDAGPYNAANSARDGFNYRTGATDGGDILNDSTIAGTYVPMGGNTGGNASNGDLRSDRPGTAVGTTTTVTSSFSVGWASGWYNYTRNIPAGNYNAYAALSYDGRGDGQLSGRLERVTAGRGTTNQTVELLGTFSRFGSGGWGPFALVPMQDGSGNLASFAVAGSGATTVRYTANSGDFDHYVLVPAATPPVEPRVTGITRSGANVVITYVGGTLQESSTLGSGYANVAGASGGTATITPVAGAGARFYRVVR